MNPSKMDGWAAVLELHATKLKNRLTIAFGERLLRRANRLGRRSEKEVSKLADDGSIPPSLSPPCDS
jgi:hypothetical protein